MRKMRVTAAEVPEGEPGTYSQAFRCGDFLFMSGQIGMTAEGRLVSTGFEPQARQAFVNMRALLRAAGGTMEDVVTLTIYVTDMRNRGAFVKVRREFFDGDFPCGTLVEVSALAFGAMVEIEAIAYLARGGSRS